MAIFRTLLIALAALALSGCGGGAGDNTYRYRLTVEVDTPEGLKTGSSVIEGKISEYWNVTSLSSGPGIGSSARGEAVAVDLPDGQTLFALLRSDDHRDWASRIMLTFIPRFQGKGGARESLRALWRMSSERELPRYSRFGAGGKPRSAYPMLVTFGDLDDPTSVELVDPDDLAATFGEGTSLKRITVQITDDPVTTGIEKRLGWWSRTREAGGSLIPMIKNASGRYEAAPGYDEALVDLGLSNFSTETYK